MAKTLRTAALVVGAVALIATGVGAVAALTAGTTLAAGVASVGVAAGLGAGFVGTLSAVAAGLSFLAAVTAKRPSISMAGDQTKFTINKDQGIPWAFGRTSVAGWIVHRQTYDALISEDNAYQTLFAVWSAGPVHQIETFQVDKAAVTFTGGATVGGLSTGGALGIFNNYMFLNAQVGATPEAAALPAVSFAPTVPGWTSASKLSGYAAYSWTVRWDKKGKKFPNGVPQPSAILKGAMVWDPRKDSTYPGGSGAHRPDNPATWEYSENNWLLALQWARGVYQNGKRILGIGFALTSINVPAFVEAANVADANGWTCGGVAYSTDGKWDVLKKFCAAGSGEPIQLGGTLSCTFDTPRVSLATIRISDIIGDASVTATPTGRERINGVIPRYRSEEHDWSLVPAAPVQIGDYVAADGRPRTRELTWEYVQDVDQVSELATYAIVNAREFGPIVTPLKLKWIGYKPGDCLTIESPELGMDSQDILVLRRQLDPATGAVTLTSRSETAAKHAYALGQTGTPPPTPSLQVLGDTELPVPGYNAGWSGVLDDDGLRPEDGATKGAPAGTYVADLLAEEIVEQAIATLALTNEAREQLAAMLVNHMQSILLQETREQRQQALTYLDGESLHTVQRRETIERIEGDSAIVTTMDLIGAKSIDGGAFILNLETVKTGPGQSIGERFEEIDATLTTQAGDIAANYSELVTADASEASARASAITALTATVTTLSGTVTANYSTLNTAISNESSARASALISVYAAIGTNTSSITSLGSALSTESSTRAAADTALTASIGSVSSTVTTHSAAITDLTGRTGAYWSITTNASSGATAFIAAQAETSPGTVTSNVAFGAKEVHISNPGVGSGWVKVLSVVGGMVNVYGKLTATDAVTTPNIVAGNVTQMESTLSGSAVTATGGWDNILSGAWHSFTLDHDAEVLVLFTGRANYTGASSLIVRMLLYDAAETYIAGVEGPSAGSGSYMPNPCFSAKFSLGAGLYHVSPQFLGDAGDVEMRSGSGVIVFWRYR